jgi:2-polyprenyl-3-methyl-5-hydroxy-6-metoxy-1,4-benzoquinol methylase
MAAPNEIRDPVNLHGFEVNKRIGETRLGVLKNWEWYDDPKRILFSMSRYKFVSKMLNGRRHALEIGCGDAFNAPIILQSVKSLTVTDFDPVFIEDAKARMKAPWTFEAKVHNLLEGPLGGSFDALYSLDVLEHIPREQEDLFIANALQSLEADGEAIFGMPSLESQQWASKASKEGHVNCKSGDELVALMRKYFRHVFLFSMNDEVVHTGYARMAHYLIVLCCGKK